MKRFRLTPLAALMLALASNIAAAQTGDGTTSPDSKLRPTGPASSAPHGAPGSSAAPNAAKSAARETSSQQAWERTHRASKIIGMDVVNREGEKVGDVEDIVLDQKGNVTYAVVSTGGFLGVGDKLHAVPWRSLQTNTGTDKFLLDVDREKLRKAPGFDQSSFPDVNDPKWSNENRKYFPVAGNARTSASPAPAAASSRGTTGSPSRSDVGPSKPGTGRTGTAADVPSGTSGIGTSSSNAGGSSAGSGSGGSGSDTK